MAGERGDENQCSNYCFCNQASGCSVIALLLCVRVYLLPGCVVSFCIVMGRTFDESRDSARPNLCRTLAHILQNLDKNSRLPDWMTDLDCCRRKALYVPLKILKYSVFIPIHITLT